MRAATLLPTVVLVLTACSSAPSTDREALPDRPDVQRPDGLVPDGLTDVRNQLADQRATAREQENALMIKPNALSQTPSDSSFTDTLLSPFTGLWHLLGGK
jgi:hypothetical protein